MCLDGWLFFIEGWLFEARRFASLHNLIRFLLLHIFSGSFRCLSQSFIKLPRLASSFVNFPSQFIKMEGSSLPLTSNENYWKRGYHRGTKWTVFPKPFQHSAFQEHTGFFYKAYPKKRESNFELVHSKPFFTKKQIKIQRKQAQN